MRDEVHILVYCPIDTLQWGQTHSALARNQVYTGLNTRICTKMKVLGTDFKKTPKKGSFFQQEHIVKD